MTTAFSVRNCLTALSIGLGLALTPVTARAEFLDFTVVEGSVPGALDNTYTADKLNGGYSEVITFTGTEFEASAYASFGQYFKNEGGDVVSPTQIGCLGDNCYNIYAVFTATGDVVGGTLVGETAVVSLYLDVDQDTTLAFAGDGGDGINRGNTSDDLLILFADQLIFGVGDFVPVPGFELQFANVTIVDPAGTAYWPTLAGLTLSATIDGDLDEFEFTGTQTVTGDLSAVFTDAAVPEPATLTLLGFGLVAGSAARARRRKK